MPGFAVAPFVTGMTGARVLRIAPNGDIFLALSRPEGKVMVIRAGADMSNPKVETFADGLRDAYGIAFYPPGPNPQWVYVGEYGKVVRFPYKNGDLTASGAPQTVVSDLATGGNHWTRDVAFSPDGKTMYVAVGSASNVAEQMGPPPADFAAFEQSHSPRLGLGPGGMARQRPDLYSRRERQERLCLGHPQLLGAGSAARHRRRLLRHQRARPAGRQSAAGLRHERQAGRVLRLALVLHRRP